MNVVSHERRFYYFSDCVCAPKFWRSDVTPPSVCILLHPCYWFIRYKILRAHILPLTNCAFNKSGDKFITGSYDRTCKVWNTATGDELLTLEGHRNVVYAIAFNNPYGDKIVTGALRAHGSLRLTLADNAHAQMG